MAAAVDAAVAALPTTEAHVLAGHEGAVLNVRFNAAGTYCLSCGKVGAGARGWLVGWLAGWLVGWLVGWVAVGSDGGVK
jgi:hypothetical protein